MYNLRDYQVAPVHAGVTFFKSKKVKPSLIVAPTAFGKSIVIGHITNNIEGKTLVLQPSKELLEQNYEKFTGLGGEASIYSASFNSREIGNVTYATIGSIKTLGNVFKDLGFTNLIVDEAHLYPRDSDSMFGKFIAESKIKKVLGLTASPFKLQNNTDVDGDRYSKLVMLTNRGKTGAFFKDILHITQVSEIVNRGYWTKLTYEIHKFNTKGLVYNTIGAEYTDDSMKRMYKSEGIEDKIIDRLEELDRRSIIVFVPSVEDAKRLSSQVRNSAAVYSGMPDKERKEVIQKFRNKELRIVFNVNILSVGFDYPEVDCIIMGRPTASLAWFYQAVGRGTRIHINKKDCLIIDFVGNTTKFGRLEDLYFKQMDGKWQLFGTGGRLLTGIPLYEIGKHIDTEIPKPLPEKITIPFGKYYGKEVKEVPMKYLDDMLTNYNFTIKTLHIKEEILRLKNSQSEN